MTAALLVQGSASHLPLRDESVQCCITSPPYWGLRQYAGEQREVYGGDAGHAHEWGDERTLSQRIRNGAPGGLHEGREVNTLPVHVDIPSGAFCACGAWFGALGLEPTPELYVAHMVAIFREVRRVLRKDGTLWLNLGDSYASTPPGNKTQGVSASSTLHGVNGASGQYRATLGQSVQTKRSTITAGLKPKDLVGIPWMVAFALRADGWYLRSDIIWAKPNPMPESVQDRPTSSHEHLFLLSKSERYYYDADAIREAATWERWSSKQTTPKYEGHDREAASRLGREWTQEELDRYTERGRNKRTVWTIATQPWSGAHFATFPEALVEPCILAGSSPTACGVCGAPWARVLDIERGERDDAGRTHSLTDTRQGKTPVPERGWEAMRTTTGWRPTCAHDDGSGTSTILDPFAGSGTTGRVAIRHGRSYVGLDISREYLAEQAKKRIDNVQTVMLS